jgi:Recombinase zinc beta ribbon domain
VTTGPILLTGLAVCASCNGGMTLRTGTSKTGAVHRYYTCSTCARKGKTVCKGRSIPMAKLDSLVTTHMNERLFQPERLAMILSSLSSRRSEKADPVNARVTALQREVTDADDKLKRLYRLVEDGMTEMDDVLKDRLNSLKADRDRAKAALERAKSHSSQAIQIDPAMLEQFGRTMRENFSSGSIPFRKAYLQSLIDVIEVDDTQIRIKGSKDVLERAVLASRNGAIPGSQMSTGWRAVQNKTANPQRIEGTTGLAMSPLLTGRAVRQPMAGNTYCSRHGLRSARRKNHALARRDRRQVKPRSPTCAPIVPCVKSAPATTCPPLHFLLLYEGVKWWAHQGSNLGPDD